MDTLTIANDFVKICSTGDFDQAGEKYWSPDVVSVEPMPGDMQVATGVAAVRAKGEWWYANHEVHGVTVSGPYVSGDQFIVRFEMDLTPKASGTRIQMDEVGIYDLKDGKIIRESFFYLMKQD
jgi:ketosteroid isomerase-like protein